MKQGLKNFFITAMALCSALPVEGFAEMMPPMGPPPQARAGVGVGVNVNVRRQIVAVPHSGPCYTGCSHMPPMMGPPRGAHAAGGFQGGGFVRARARGGCGRQRCGAQHCRTQCGARRQSCGRGFGRGGCGRSFSVNVSVRFGGGRGRGCRRC